MPVVRAKKALRNGRGSMLEVLVDNKTAMHNLLKNLDLSL